MTDFWLLDRIRARVFVVDLPGLTRSRERFLIRSCWRLAVRARRAGIPFGTVWGQIGNVANLTIQRMRTEQERETFSAIMQRLRMELSDAYRMPVRKAG
ncbi:hypothetical protein [Aquisphaera insulae]|uniref:hypothetical protein n=1 Tax=Aquisphaera insulae TaxID=2712864 RepID=UPI0013EB743F|nr:hypothetical protein [Aquisphaera insulae]